MSVPGEQASNEVGQSAALIERMLDDPALRGRFRADAAAVLREHGLHALAAGLPAGAKALHTLELRESRSSLAGAMVAAAAEGVDLTHVVEHAAPRLGHDAGRAFERLLDRLGRHHHAAKPSRPSIGPEAKLPALATPPAPAHTAPAGAGGGPPSAGGAQPSAGATPAGTGPTPAGTGPTPAGPGSAPSAPSGHGGAAEVAAPADLQTSDVLHYPGDAAPPQQIAAWMGAHAKQAGLPPALPVMAALTESGLHNLPYGDRDSVGFFQMRLGIWNEGPYAGLSIQSPPAVAVVHRSRPGRARSESGPGRGPRAPGASGSPASSSRRPSTAVATSCSSAPPASCCTGRTSARRRRQHPAVPLSREALNVAMRYLGTPYQWGGSSPATGFDCSGLVQYSYAQEGIQLPRVAADQFAAGVPVSRDQLQPGDAVFFADSSGYVHHVGLYIGDGRFIDAPQTGEDVRVDSLSEPYFAAQYAGARRFVAGAVGDPSRYARTVPTVKP